MQISGTLFNLTTSRPWKFGHINHFTVACLVAWSLNESEAGGDIVLVETFLPFLC